MVIKASGANFELFCKDFAVKKQAIHDKCMSQVGQKPTEDILAEHKKRNEELLQESYDVLPEEWRVLANKKDKTPEDFAKMDKIYKEAFLNFGRDYKLYVDKTYGNGDGILTLNEYIKSEDNMESQEAENAFQNINLNNDDEIDDKEMAALMSTFDMDVTNGNINGRLKYYDIMANQINLTESPISSRGKAIKNKLQGMYNFLFGN